MVLVVHSHKMYTYKKSNDIIKTYIKSKCSLFIININSLVSIYLKSNGILVDLIFIYTFVL